MNSFWRSEDKIFANDLLQLFVVPFQKTWKVMFLKPEKYIKYVFSNTGLYIWIWTTAHFFISFIVIDYVSTSMNLFCLSRIYCSIAVILSHYIFFLRNQKMEPNNTHPHRTSGQSAMGYREAVPPPSNSSIFINKSIVKVSGNISAWIDESEHQH